ncbi:MAG: UDP-4-amino-4,6-dideoxy-N-acetyl-beta-L-altrosamine transaminase [Chlamydiales bacterium]|nr:UDP-4-amino-4,6-dideoxy-N-acetyl-beta-L-altrosamine transaminase [Chlamydiales bacterium]MCH9620251.1 UDP-4-amino-4,6-dideoxy-N-acetyl-beta-L-altrosamine transaminase [Chlamydiales bacterium]MCH9622839.1 UDP-4-amino-4,6-dideoxy-N-acetyl-beta-L-altrosamine transaminase [Chlamydiales bacterium]
MIGVFMSQVQKLPFLPIARAVIDESDRQSVHHALTQTVITRGALVEKFEREIAEYCNAKFACAFNSGTSALDAAYFAAELQAGQKVVTSPNTFVGTFVGALRLGAEIEFVDIDRKSGNMEVEEVKRGDICVPVHFSGIPVDVASLRERLSQAVIIEDAAHALGALYPDGKKVGGCPHSDMTVFSFHPAKSITTGEGGMVTTNSSHLYDRLRLFRNNGMVRDPSLYPGYYRVEETSGNYNITDFQAALGSSQLKKLDMFIEKRRRLMRLYREAFVGKRDVHFFAPEYDACSSHHLCVVQVEGGVEARAARMRRLQDFHIGTQVHYPPAYAHPIFSKKMKLCSMEEYFASALSLPLFVDMEEADVRYVAEMFDV